MTHHSQKSPQDAVDAVLNQYAGAADEDRDQRAAVTPVQVLPGTGDGSPISPASHWTRDAVYPLLGSARGRIADGGSAAADLPSK